MRLSSGAVLRERGWLLQDDAPSRTRGDGGGGDLGVVAPAAVLGTSSAGVGARCVPAGCGLCIGSSARCSDRRWGVRAVHRIAGWALGPSMMSRSGCTSASGGRVLGAGATMLRHRCSDDDASTRPRRGWSVGPHEGMRGTGGPGLEPVIVPVERVGDAVRRVCVGHAGRSILTKPRPAPQRSTWNGDNHQYHSKVAWRWFGAVTSRRMWAGRPTMGGPADTNTRCGLVCLAGSSCP